MNFNIKSVVPQIQRDLYPNYNQELITEPFNTANIIINPNQANQQNNSPQSTKINRIQSGYNPYEIMSFHINQIQIQNNNMSYDSTILSNLNNPKESEINSGNNSINKSKIIKN